MFNPSSGPHRPSRLETPKRIRPGEFLGGRKSDQSGQAGAIFNRYGFTSIFTMNLAILSYEIRLENGK